MGTLTYTFDELLARKNSGKVSEKSIEKLRADADDILTKPFMVVTDIKLPRPSVILMIFTVRGLIGGQIPILPTDCRLCAVTAR